LGEERGRNFAAVALTVTAIALDVSMDAWRAEKKCDAPWRTAGRAGDRNDRKRVLHIFAWWAWFSLWLPVLFFAPASATDFLRGLALKAGHSGWGANGMLQTWWGRALVASRGAAACMGNEVRLFLLFGSGACADTRPVALLGSLAGDAHVTIRTLAHILTWSTAAFCIVRGLPC